MVTTQDRRSDSDSKETCDLPASVLTKGESRNLAKGRTDCTADQQSYGDQVNQCLRRESMLMGQPLDGEIIPGALHEVLMAGKSQRGTHLVEQWQLTSPFLGLPGTDIAAVCF